VAIEAADAGLTEFRTIQVYPKDLRVFRCILSLR